MMSRKVIIGLLFEVALYSFILLYHWSSPSPTIAGIYEAKCMHCHNDILAPDIVLLIKRLKNVDEFIKAVRESKEPVMHRFEDDILKSVAEEFKLSKEL
jgi:hypothetical protein